MTSKDAPIDFTDPRKIGETRYSDWLLIDQKRIDLFAEATNDPDPLHIDPAYAAQFSAYGKTIAFGFLTLSLLTYLHHQVFAEIGEGFGLNYGFNRVRLPAPVPVDTRIRAAFQIKSAEERADGNVLITQGVTIEVEGDEKPALVADWLTMWVRDGVTRPGMNQGAVKDE